MKIEFNDYFIDTNVLIYYTFDQLGFMNKQMKLLNY